MPLRQRTQIQTLLRRQRLMPPAGRRVSLTGTRARACGHFARPSGAFNLPSGAFNLPSGTFNRHSGASRNLAVVALILSDLSTRPNQHSRPAPAGEYGTTVSGAELRYARAPAGYDPRRNSRRTIVSGCADAPAGSSIVIGLLRPGTPSPPDPAQRQSGSRARRNSKSAPRVRCSRRWGLRYPPASSRWGRLRLCLPSACPLSGFAPPAGS